MRLHSAFEQQKGSGLDFSSAKAPKPEKSESGPFHKNMVRKVYTAKISGPYQLFNAVAIGPDPFFL